MKVVGVPSRPATSAMLRPTPPKEVRQFPFVLWYSVNLPFIVI